MPPSPSARRKGLGLNGLTDLLVKAGPTRLFAALGITALVCAALFALAFQIGREDNALLFSGVDLAEANEITQRLDQAGIRYELAGDGSTIMVPRSRVNEARMMLSAEGLPSRGSVGYEIFDTQDALSATQFQQNINRLRALEGELARTIVSLDGVERARVHLVLPERQLFERERQQPSASIVLDTRGEVNAGQVRAIRNLVASAVPGLEPSRVTVLDGRGRLLAAGEGGDAALGPDGVDQRQAAVEERIRRTVLDIVESVVGPGAARVQVTAEMDFNRVTQSQEIFDPEGRVVRSTTTTEETANEQERDAQSGATAGRNLPDGPQGEDEARRTNASGRTQETINYEISRTQRTEIIEGGRVRRLSVAVAVDGVTTPGADGAPGEWAPRDQAELDRIAALVRSAVGFDAQRGDQVEIVNVRFAPRGDAQGTEASEPGLLDQIDAMRAAEIAALLIVALVFTFFVLRPLVTALLKGPRQDAPALAEAVPALAAPAAADATPALEPPAPAPELKIDLSQIRGKVNDNVLKQIAEVVEQNPTASVSIVRGWLSNAL